jgi:hypothetical protein
VEIRNVVFEKAMNSSQTAAIRAGSNWTIGGNEIRLNHAWGIEAGSANQILNNYIHHNGQLGLAGGGTGTLIQDNEIAYNNPPETNFNWFWEAGGSKWVRTTDLSVVGNYSHHNGGPGLWTDIDNINTRYQGNTLERNDGPGIMHEISFDAVIHENILRGNGAGMTGGIWYGQTAILVSASRKVEVFDNTVIDSAGGIGLMQQNRGISTRFGLEHLLMDVVVHNNTTALTSGHTGLVANHRAPDVYTSFGNHFEDNTYRLPDLSYGQHFQWGGAARTMSEWRQLGNDDVGGVFQAL